MKRLNPRDIVIVDTIRTATTQINNGGFHHLNPQALSAQLIRTLLEKNCFNLDDIEGIFWGSNTQHHSFAREVIFQAKLPMHISGYTTSSSFQALQHAIAHIASTQGDLFIVGGIDLPTSQPNPTQVDEKILAEMHHITRSQEDHFAVQSHQRATTAMQNGYFKNEILPIAGHNTHGFQTIYTHDAFIQTNANLDAFSAVNSATPHQAIPAAGASAVLLMSYECAKKANLKPKAVIRGIASMACEPIISGYALVPCIQKVLKRSGLKLKQIQTFELHENSACQILSNLKELNLLTQQDKVNMYGGAIALGYPPMSNGTRLMTTLMNVMEQQKTNLGLVSLSDQSGQATSLILEMV